jgi:ribosomal protein S18 acetylase RimI-like enzyme
MPASSQIRITHTQPTHAAACAELEQICYPTLADDEKLRPEQFERHIQLFPRGQFVAIDDARGGRVVGATGGFLTDIETVKTHNFYDMTSHGWFSRHDPAGRYYHGATMTVHPDYRGRGIARQFYDARKTMCAELGLDGQIICGMMPDFVRFKAYIDAESYVRHVQAGLLFDATLTVQLRNGFAFAGLLKDYFEDPPSDGWAALMICPSVTGALG